jgi:hypothetical protein
MGVESMMHGSPVYGMAVHEAATCPAVLEAMGSPISVGWLTSGEISETGDSGFASLNIPVHGSRTQGYLLLRAQRVEGAWKIDLLSLEYGVDEIEITAGGVSKCHN